MFFTAKDIQISSSFKVNLCEGQSLLLKNVLDSSRHTLFPANPAQFEGEKNTWFRMELCENRFEFEFYLIETVDLLMLLNGIQS